MMEKESMFGEASAFTVVHRSVCVCVCVCVYLPACLSACLSWGHRILPCALSST